MPFTLLLSSGSERSPDPIELSLHPAGSFAERPFAPGQRPLFLGNFPFPQPRSTQQIDLRDVTYQLIDIPYFDLWGRISETAFTISQLGADDILSIVAVSAHHFLGSIFHTDQKRAARQCVVRCADGRSSQDCVVCEQGNVRIKICC